MSRRMISLINLWTAACLLSLAGCRPIPAPEPTPTPTPDLKRTVEVYMDASLLISEVRFDRAFYQPGQQAAVRVSVRGDHARPLPVQLAAAVTHLGKEIDRIEREVEIPPGESFFTVEFQPPAASPRGYGLDLCLTGPDGRELACAWTAFDVLDHWTQTPRYGFLVDFAPGKEGIPEMMDTLTRFHINGLQFYDWMYRHDQFLTDQESYRDPLGRLLSRETVERLIAAAHERGIAAMPYTAIYASSDAFYREHPDWALYQASGDPFRLGENFLVYMDPRPGSAWVKHLLGEFEEILDELDFDGIHLDQYGDPKAAMDASGKSFPLDEPIAETIDLTKDLVTAHDPEGVVIFNAVNNWPIEEVAQTEQDVVYIEVWPPHIWYSDIHRLIVEAQALSGGKPVVLAAYIDPTFEHNARLLNAVIFASGGGHIELGEGAGMLADPYFPEYKAMSPDLAEAMARYYDFTVRYQDVIGPRAAEATRAYREKVAVSGASTEPRLQINKVWPLVRESEGRLAVSLVNLQDIGTPEWTEEAAGAPAPLGPTEVRLTGLEREVEAVWTASPDGEDLSPQELDFAAFEDQDGAGIRVEIPDLNYWRLIVLEWKD